MKDQAKTSRQAQAMLRRYADPRIAKNLGWFFKTGKGQYGEGDRFIGVVIPRIRAVAKQYADLPLGHIDALMKSPIHEERMLAVIILVGRYRKETPDGRERIYRFYLRRLKFVNNWDLVDGSAPYIVGPHVAGTSKAELFRLAGSPRVWDRRVAMMGMAFEIKSGKFDDALKMAERLRDDPHNLIQKAVGWMLREIGNRNRAVEEKFLKRHYRRMPRTMLRYAIEKFPSRRRLSYLRGAA